jgi:hypothetical protein
MSQRHSTFSTTTSNQVEFKLTEVKAPHLRQKVASPVSLKRREAKLCDK